MNTAPKSIFGIKFITRQNGIFEIHTEGFNSNQLFALEMFLLQATKEAKDIMELNQHLEAADTAAAEDDDDVDAIV